MHVYRGNSHVHANLCTQGKITTHTLPSHPPLPHFTAYFTFYSFSSYVNIRSCDHCLHLYLRTHARNEVYKRICTRVDSEVCDIEEMFALKQFRGGLAAVSAGPRLTRFLRLPPNPSDVLLQRHDLLPRGPELLSRKTSSMKLIV